MPLVGIGTLPTPFSPASVPLPPETGGRGHTSQGVGGWGEFQFRRGAYTVVLFICTYFVPVLHHTEPVFVNVYGVKGINSEESIPPVWESIPGLLKMFTKSRAGIFKQSMGARNRVGIGLSYRPAKLHRLAEILPWNRFLGSIKV